MPGMAGPAIVSACYILAPAMERDVSTQPHLRMSPEEYLEFERNAEFKNEYIDGEVVAMTGGTRRHNRISINILTELNALFRDGRCEVFGADLRTKVSVTGAYLYPDVVAVCGEAHFEDDHLDTLVNPRLIMEILSKSTESYDRGRKFKHYPRIKTLREYVLVAQSECRVERYSRQDDGKWLYTEITDSDATLELASVGCRLTLSAIYERVTFETPGPTPAS